MMTFSTFLARYGVGGGARPRRPLGQQASRPLQGLQMRRPVEDIRKGQLACVSTDVHPAKRVETTGVLPRQWGRLGRGDFLRLAGLGFAASALPAFGAVGRPMQPLTVRRETVEVGAKQPFSVLHVSDSHLARIDSRDGDELYSFARSRSRIGRELGEYYLDESVHHARAKKLRLIHTGDTVRRFRSRRRYCI